MHVDISWGRKVGWFPGVVFLLAMISAVAGCGGGGESSRGVSGGEAGIRDYAVTGMVREVKMDGRTVVVRHEKIPGYMEAMTMPFEVREPKELAGVGAGDKVMFRMRVTEKEGWIDRVQVLAKSKLDAVPPDPTFRQVRDVDPLKVGDLMPDYHFTNEMGHAVGLSDYRGRAFAFTFIFTRCPFPNFCPRMTSNFADVVKLMPRAGGVTNWHLFSISFDPEYDTPNRLKVYGERNGPAYDPRH